MLTVGVFRMHFKPGLIIKNCAIFTTSLHSLVKAIRWFWGLNPILFVRFFLMGLVAACKFHYQFRNVAHVEN